MILEMKQARASFGGVHFARLNLRDTSELFPRLKWSSLRHYLGFTSVKCNHQTCIVYSSTCPARHHLAIEQTESLPTTMTESPRARDVSGTAMVSRRGQGEMTVTVSEIGRNVDFTMGMVRSEGKGRGIGVGVGIASVLSRRRKGGGSMSF